MTTQASIIASYQISTTQQEIVEVMIKSAADNVSILWQTHEGHRTIYPVSALDLDLKSHQVTLSFSPKSSLLEPHLPVYVKLSFRETVFKGQLVKAMPGQILLHLPEEIHWRDFREKKRMAFRRGERHVVTRPYFAHLRADQLPSLKVFLRDISEQGMGIYISQDNVDFFRPGKLIELTALGENGLPRALLGHVKWLKHTETKGEREAGMDWKVGIKMIDPIPARELEVFQNGGTKARRATEALLDTDVLSDEFKEMLHNEVNRTLKKMKQRPALAKYLQQLEIIRGHDEYIGEHIQVLTVVCTFIARSLGWVSEASLEKFVYAAYTHDAPLFAHPRLAPLKDKIDLEMHRSQLTTAEVELFFKAPEEAAKLAALDKSAPPDVEMMLALQKELPDGTGFPRGFNQSKIPPMAALFIIAHSLTDAIMANPQWSMDEWYRGAGQKYRGGHFSKIMTSLESMKISLKRR